MRKNPPLPIFVHPIHKLDPKRPPTLISRKHLLRKISVLKKTTQIWGFPQKPSSVKISLRLQMMMKAVMQAASIPRGTNLEDLGLSDGDRMSSCWKEVDGWINGLFHLLINGVYWGSNPPTKYLLTS